MDVITHDDNAYLPCSITRDYAESTLFGEWIEIKYSLGAEKITSFTNDITDPYVDAFSNTDNEVTLEQTDEAAQAICESNGFTLSSTFRYIMTATVTGTMDTPGSALWVFSVEYPLVIGDNSWEITGLTGTQEVQIITEAGSNINATIVVSFKQITGV